MNFSIFFILLYLFFYKLYTFFILNNCERYCFFSY